MVPEGKAGPQLHGLIMSKTDQDWHWSRHCICHL